MPVEATAYKARDAGRWRGEVERDSTNSQHAEVVAFNALAPDAGNIVLFVLDAFPCRNDPDPKCLSKLLAASSRNPIIIKIEDDHGGYGADWKAAGDVTAQQIQDVKKSGRSKVPIYVFLMKDDMDDMTVTTAADGKPDGFPDHPDVSRM